MNPDLRDFLFALLQALIECQRGDEPIDAEAVREAFAERKLLEWTAMRILVAQAREQGVRPWWRRREVAQEVLPTFLEEARRRAIKAFDLQDDALGEAFL